MTFFEFISTTVIGIITGSFYGCYFLKNNLKSQCLDTCSIKKARNQLFMSSVFFAFIRIMLICGLFYYFILHSSTARTILVLLSFLTAFWCIIIKKKVCSYGRF